MNGSPEGKDCANLLGYPRHAEHTGRLHRHRVKVKISTLPKLLWFEKVVLCFTFR